MNKDLRESIIDAISTAYPFSTREVEHFYNLTKSLDEVITLCDYATNHALGLEQAYRHIKSLESIT